MLLILSIGHLELSTLEADRIATDPDPYRHDLNCRDASASLPTRQGACEEAKSRTDKNHRSLMW